MTLPTVGYVGGLIAEELVVPYHSRVLTLETLVGRESSIEALVFCILVKDPDTDYLLLLVDESPYLRELHDIPVKPHHIVLTQLQDVNLKQGLYRYWFVRCKEGLYPLRKCTEEHLMSTVNIRLVKTDHFHVNKRHLVLVEVDPMYRQEPHKIPMASLLPLLPANTTYGDITGALKSVEDSEKLTVEEMVVLINECTEDRIHGQDQHA